MTSSNSNRKNSTRKPEKPAPNFPLYAHASGRWAKKIKGKFYYFGEWDNPQEALEEYKDLLDDLEHGRDPGDRDVFTIRDAVNHFLTSAENRVESGDMRQRTFYDYKRTADRLLKHFGRSTSLLSITPLEFEQYRTKIAKSRNPTGVGNEVQRVRTILSYSNPDQAGLVDEPVRFGPNFKRPSKRQQRIHRHSQPKKFMPQEEIRMLLDELGVHLRAMVYLGLNGGYDPAGCGELPLKAVDLEAGWIDYFRPKTGVQRLTPLWPETIEALRLSLERRPQPTEPDAEELFFLTRHGRSWVKSNADSKITRKIGSALRELGVDGNGKGFYWLRHTFATVAEETGDESAKDVIMGQATESIRDTYIEDFPRERLIRVSNHVRRWFLGKEAGNE